jgi:histidinol-phosphatase (PHP family)
VQAYLERGTAAAQDERGLGGVQPFPLDQPEDLLIRLGQLGQHRAYAHLVVDLTGVVLDADVRPGSRLGGQPVAARTPPDLIGDHLPGGGVEPRALMVGGQLGEPAPGNEERARDDVTGRVGAYPTCSETRQLRVVGLEQILEAPSSGRVVRFHTRTCPSPAPGLQGLPPRYRRGMLPADGHVHSEWSWDALGGSMERTCERAIRLGLPAVAFTEHIDYSPFVIDPQEIVGIPHMQKYTVDGLLQAPKLDVQGYLECVERCRAKFPALRIISGVEIGEPHRHREKVAQLLSGAGFERVLGSLHCLPFTEWYAEPPRLFQERPAADVMRDYLAEVVNLVEGFGGFGVLAHIDYPVRYWPVAAEPFDVKNFEDEFRAALRALASSGRALEVNTASIPLPDVVRWFREEGGTAVTFGSDAHAPDQLARGFAEAVAMVEAQGFRAGAHPYAVWLA